MRPIRPPRRGLRAALAALIALTALLAATVAPAAASDAGPIQVPALTGFVTDACTGFPIMNGLTVGVTRAVPGGVDPGPVGLPSSPPFFGFFTYRTHDPGPVSLTVSAPGYTPLGGTPGVTVLQDPGPVGLPAGQGLSIGLLLDIRLMPAGPIGGALGSACRPPGPPIFPALAGRVVDGATGRGLRGLTVGLAPLDPVTTQPGPINHPPSPNFLGFFSFGMQDPGPIGFGFQFYAAAPDHTSLGADPLHPPSPNGPGVAVTVGPGPIQVPADSGFVNESVILSVALPVGLPGG
jgi:hypothetical protein